MFVLKIVDTSTPGQAVLSAFKSRDAQSLSRKGRQAAEEGRLAILYNAGTGLRVAQWGMPLAPNSTAYNA